MAKIPVVFCFDDRILLGAGVSILSLIDAARDTTSYDIRVLHPGLAQSAQDALREITAGSRHSIEFKEIPSSRFDGVPKNSGSWTEIVYYRLLAAEFLPDCDRVIYSDVDVFFKKDMYGVFEIDMNGCEWAGVAAEANTPNTVMHRHFPENTNDTIYFSGFMVMNLKAMREQGAIERYFDTIRTCKDRLKFFDLDVLNIATPEIARVPFDYVVLEDVFEAADVSQSKDFAYLKSVYSEAELQAARENAAIVHFAGPRGKPWQRQRMPKYYAETLGRLPRRLQKLTRRDLRRKWLSKKGYRKHFERTEHQKAPV